MSRNWSEAYILSRIRATLRRLSMQMPTVRICKLAARRRYSGIDKRQKFEYKCAKCEKWFPEKGTQVDHIVPAGSMKTFEDIGPFARRLLFAGAGELQCLCRGCHKEKTLAERLARKAAKPSEPPVV